MRILVVEDEKKIAQAIQKSLEAEHYTVILAHTGEAGFFLINSQTFDVVILDWMLPQRSGLEILSTLRSRGIHTPVLMLTARDSVNDRVQGLDCGADDYLVKPFAFPELHARLRVLLRRHNPETANTLKLADLEVDIRAHRACRAGRLLELTAREFELLVYLLLHPQQVVSREMLARDVWKETHRATPLDNVIDVHVARLRRKLDDPFRLRLLQTVRGVGFILRETDS